MVVSAAAVLCRDGGYVRRGEISFGRWVRGCPGLGSIDF